MEESLEVEAYGRGSWLASERPVGRTTRGHRPSDELGLLCRVGTPLDGGEPWTRLQDETSLRSEASEETAERLRKPESGAVAGHWKPPQRVDGAS
jgi:hypothetical protein